VILMLVEGRAHAGKPVNSRAKLNSQQSIFSAREMKLRFEVCVCVCGHVCCRTVWSFGEIRVCEPL